GRRRDQRAPGRAEGLGGVRLRLRRGRPGAGQDGHHHRRRARGDRRSVPRGQGVPGELRHHRRRQPGAGARDRGPGAVRPLRPGRGAPADARGARQRMTAPPTTEDLLRTLAPQVLGALVRRYGHFDAAEDAVQEALLAAVQQWPAEGRPDNPAAWLSTVATRRMIDQLRGDEARRRREDEVGPRLAPDADADVTVPAQDDTLTLLFLCCHPVLSPPSQLALTLRAVGGLTTAQIAHAFLVPETTMAQRISRAKQSIKAAGAR